jgi:hypothetical protein
MKKIILVAIVVVITLASFRVTAQTNGKIGDLNWSFKDSTLFISGVGKMPDNIGDIIVPPPAPEFTPGNPISTPRKIVFPLKCKSVVIDEGATNIGMAAFSGCTTLVSVAIPKSITNIGLIAFSGCDNLISVEIKCITPPKLEIEPFKVNPFGKDVSSIILYVPKGTKAAYTKADGWKDFKIIKEK